MLGLRFLNQILSVFSPHTMSTEDPFVQFFTSPATMSTTMFLNHYRSLILLSKSAPHHLDAVLNCFMVKTISLNKHMEMTSQHEFLSIDVYDVNCHESHLLFLERTASASEPPSNSDSASPTDPYYNFIHHLMQSLPLVASSPSEDTLANQELEDIPLLQVHTAESPSPTPSSKALLHTSESASPTPSFKDLASLASARVMCRSSESLSRQK